MKLGFTTLGTPSWDLDTTCEKARAFGFQGVDFRGLLDEIDVTVLPEFTTDLPQTVGKLTGAGLVAGISTSLKICDDRLQEENLEEARRTIPIAAKLGMGIVRVFGGGDAKSKSTEEMADIGASTMAAVLALEGANGLEWVLETHDSWTRSPDCKLVLDRVSNANFGILWDVGHTSRVSEEKPEESLAVFGDRVKHIHIKDAIYDTSHPHAMDDGWRYVEPGTGQLPLAETIGLLKQRGYDGWLIFEHEKRWHKELPEPEEVFPKFISWANPLI